MKSAKVLYKIAYLLIVIFVAVFTVGYAFAWFFERKNAEFTISGSSAGAYFESGDGSEETPFIISNPTHMHNLAVLQNMGKLDKKYYFQIKKTISSIDMAGRYIPPIGNDEHPFIGDFDGNGKALKNLNVTTNKTLLKDEYPAHAKSTYEFSQAVGLFGMTGATSDIHNVILENPSVDVAATDTLYSSTTRAYAGLAVGYVAGKASSIGVRALDGGSALDVKKAGYSTFNSILGMLGDGVTSAVTGGGHGSGGSGSAFGANFDIGGLVDRLKLIHDNNEASWRLPKLGDYYLGTANEGSKATTLAGQEKIPFTVGSDSLYVGADAKETLASNNIGYVLGNQTKFYSKTYTFGDPMTLNGNTYVHTDKVIPKWIYRRIGTYGANYSTSSIEALTQSEMDALPQNIKDELFPSDGNTMKLDSISVSQTYNNVGVQIYPGSTDNGQWSPHGQISWNGNVYGEGFRGSVATVDKEVADAVDEDGYRYSEDGNKLDENGFLFNAEGHFIPAETFDYIIYSVDENGYGKDENGDYYYKYKKVWSDADYIFGKLDENGYFYNEDGYVINNFNKLIPAIDADGYALNADGIYYDASGYLIDGNGYVYGDSGEGYIADVSGLWPLSGMPTDEEGYFLNTEGENAGSRYTDEDGKEVRAYGYELATDDGVNYYLKINGVKATFKQYGANREIPAKKGAKAKVITGTEMVSSMSGKYVVAATGRAVAYHNFTKGVPLPNNGIWFKPTMAGTIRILLFAEDTGKGITLIQGHRPSATKENPFTVDYSIGGGDMTRKEVAKCDLPAYVLCYFEYEISQEEIDDGRYEYWIVKNDSGGGAGANFVYLDLGASAADDTSGIDREKAVSAIDFIYDGVEIKQGVAGDDGATAGDSIINVGDFIVRPSGTTEELYNASKTSVYFENLKAALNVVYIRLNEESGKHSGKTICLEKSTPVPDTNSEVKATNPTYVCPTIGSGGSGGGGTVVDPDPGPETPTVSGVTVTPATATVEAGKTTTLSASVTMSDGSSYGGNIAWTSSDENIATVVNGVVTAKTAGTVTITATAGGESASATITVNEKPKEPVTASKTSDWTALAANDTVLEGKSGDTTVFKVSAEVAFTAATGSVTTTSSGNVLKLELAEGYTYTITFKLGSQGTTRTFTLNGTTCASITKTSTLSKFETREWTISGGGTFYFAANDVNMYLGEITVTATPITT